MWISARTATTLAAAALLLVLAALAAPFLPRPKLPSLPRERAIKPPTSSEKFGEAARVLASPERSRGQRMAPGVPAPPEAARWADRVGNGRAVEPSAETVKRLVALLNDARTIADPRASKAEPAWVVRLVRGDHKVDVMVDGATDRLVVALDGRAVGTYAAPALHREFKGLEGVLFP